MHRIPAAARDPFSLALDAIASLIASPYGHAPELAILSVAALAALARVLP